MKMFLVVPGKRAGEEHCGGWQLERPGAHWLGQEERRPLLPAQRWRSSESQVGHSYFSTPAWMQNLTETTADGSFSSRQVGFPLLRPRGCVWPDREAQTGHCEAQVSEESWAGRYTDVNQSIHSSRFSSFCRCKESESPHAVTVYMLEPQTCQYILGVSSEFTNESHSLVKQKNNKNIFVSYVSG